MLTPGMDYDAILMYDSVELKWRDYSFDALTFRAETEQLKGAAGFVPAPSKDEHNKFLRGDGTWAIVGTECQIFNIETSEGQSHSNALAVHTGDKILNKGDIAIIQDFIVNGKFQYTSYVYNGNKEQPQLWCALDKEYNAKNVYLDSDIVFTNKHNIEETLTVSSKNLKEAFELVLERAETSVLADAKTVAFDNNVLSLKDFGKQYYKYIAESGSKETNDYQPAHYVLQVVDSEHPWKSGLEPKVVSENGVLGLGWYEPNPTTIEGVNAAIAGLQNTVNNLIIDNTNLSTVFVDEIRGYKSDYDYNEDKFNDVISLMYDKNYFLNQLRNGESLDVMAKGIADAMNDAMVDFQAELEERHAKTAQ